MNNLGRGSWVGMGLLFCLGFAVFVSAAAPGWGSSPNSNYTTSEGLSYNHNLSANITGFNNDVTFAIDTTQTSIYFTNASGRSAVSTEFISPWISITNATTGNLKINATLDSQTGFFEIPVQAKNTTDNAATTEVFKFIINATNDAPNITTVVDGQEFYWSSSASNNYTILAYDEEGHYPLNFSLDVVNCTHGALTGRNPNENCTIFSLTNISNNSASLNFSYSTAAVGTYWFRMNVTEADHTCPHGFCTFGYTNKLNASRLVRLDVLSSLIINATDCSNKMGTEGGWMNCTIDITTYDSSDQINISSNATFRSGSYINNIQSGNLWGWFYTNNTPQTSLGFLKSIDVSVLLNKSHVGNWTINLIATDGITPVTERINISVNWTESDVAIGSTDSYFLLYENRSFYLNATDNDLLIPDKGVKYEVLTFASNVSWVSVTQPSSSYSSTVESSTATILIDYIAGNLSCGSNQNCSVRINVTDTVGNSKNLTFLVEFSDDTPPVWNASKNYVNVSTEGEGVYINLTNGWVSDAENDALTFYYTNSTPFQHFNLTSSGIINFTSTDADVGFHNISLIVGDGKLNTTKHFNFTIYNVVDIPYFDPVGDQVVAEGDIGSISLYIGDNDFLIPSAQAALYNESLTLALTFTNLTVVNTRISFTFNYSLMATPNQAYYLATFTPDGVNLGEYNVTVNVTDAFGGNNVTSFFLNITSTNDAPILDIISNQTKTINDLLTIQANASDEEGSDITYAIYNLTVGGGFLTINSTTGLMNLTLNSSFAGVWRYNVTANDTSNAVGYRVFTLTVYGQPNITSPSSDYIFNWAEGNATGPISFNVSYAVNNTNLTYKIYMDKITYYNATHFNYTELISNISLRNETNYILRFSNNFTWNFTSNYTDETYGRLKNLTLIVYNPNYPELNNSVNWKVNISHVNQNVTFSGVSIPDKGPISTGSSVTINLSNYFEDADYWDRNISQNVNFTINTVSGLGVIRPYSSIDSNWILTLTTPTTNPPTTIEEILSITAYEWNSANVTIWNSTSDTFTVTFVPPTSTTIRVPTSGGGGSQTKLKHYSLKLIVPQDVIISDKNYIDIPFSVQNTGQVDLRGINLSSFVRFNDAFADDVKISLGESYIPELKFGQSENYTMRIAANTQRAGKYKATIYANITSPKFSDWADFIIELRKINESEAEQILIFTEKLVAENPECLELTEVLREAQKAFDLGEYSNSLRLAQEVTTACEEAINKNEQVRYPIAGFVKENFYYITFTTLVIFLVGFVFYIYKRVRFNKSKMNDYL